MANEIRLDTSGWDRFFKLVGDTSKWKKILRSVAAVISFKDVHDHFKRESGPKGAWKEWSPAYKNRREKMSAKFATPSAKRRAAASGKKPVDFSKKLVLTGTLQQSFITTSGRLAGSDRGNDVAVLINPVVYANRHDQGTKGMPQRQFMWLSNNAMELIAKNFLFSLQRSSGAI